MKTETSALLNAPPWSPIRGRIVGRLELLFVRDRGAGRTHRRLVGRYDFSGIEPRDREIAVPAFEAAWACACRVAKRLQVRQLREERGNAAAAAIQEARRREAEAARLAEGVKPELNLTIKREWLDMIVIGTKREEYRAEDNPQCLRLWRECESAGHFPLRPIVAVLRAGYTMDSRAAAVLVRYVSRRVGIGGRTYPRGVNGFSIHNFVADTTRGEPIDAAHFALGIPCVLRAGPYAAVKAWLATPDAERVAEGQEIAPAGESAKIAEVLSDGRDASEAAEKLRRHLAGLDAEYAKPREGACRG